ncbi:MAG: flavin reductase [Euryarchaeota archaeon]|nr:flavin reductase [Euryarchaeota archaeon]
MKSFKPVKPGVALSNLPMPVTVITVKKGSAINGMAAAWVSQVSIKPPMLMAAISPKRYTWEMMDGVELFAVCVLGEGQKQVGKVFGSVSGRSKDKFKLLGIKPELGRGGTPLIPGSTAAMVCAKKDCVLAGDHYIVVGEVVEAWKGSDAAPLTWYRAEMSALRLQF